MGIRTYADLVAYLQQRSAEIVSADLKEQGLNRPPAFINMPELTRQAELFSRKQAQEQSEDKTPVKKAEAETAGGTGEPGKVPHGHQPSEHDAMFTVSFDLVTDEEGNRLLQTTIYDEKDHGEEHPFLGSDPSPWGQLDAGACQSGPHHG